MNARTRRLRTALAAVGLLSVLAAGCAVRLGGPEPEERTTLALETEAGAAPAAVAQRIGEYGADVVLLSAPASAGAAWFAEVARQTGLALSGPGQADGTSLAFLTRKEAVGDTTIALAVEGSEPLIVHDALYEVDKHRHLDLMSIKLGPTTPLRPAAQAFLQYVATDVIHNAAVALAIDVDDPARGDSLAALLAPAFADMRECVEEEDRGALPPAQIRLLFGPEVRMSCDWVRVPDADGRAVLSKLVIRR